MLKTMCITNISMKSGNDFGDVTVIGKGIVYVCFHFVSEKGTF